jgi:hypothetical protein
MVGIYGAKKSGHAYHMSKHNRKSGTGREEHPA